MKKIISACILLCILSIYPLNISAASQEFNWYCKRTKDHSQPSIDHNMTFIEKYNGYYIDLKHSNIEDEEKIIYLTFDAGYENGNIEKILDVLKEEKVPAAFFILKNVIIKNPELIKRMTNEGHLVCNHTSTHPNIAKFQQIEVLEKELSELETEYTKVTGKELSKYFRPPEGCFSEQSLQFIDTLGYKTIFWSFAYADWDNNAQMLPDAAKKKIFDNVHNGEVMLLHPTSKTNADILQGVIRQLRNDGFRFGTLDELTGAKK